MNPPSHTQPPSSGARAIGGMEIIMATTAVYYLALALGTDPTPEQWEEHRCRVIKHVADLGGSEHQQYSAWAFLTRQLLFTYGMQAPPTPPDHPKRDYQPGDVIRVQSHKR